MNSKEKDFFDLKRFATRNVARAVGVKDADFKARPELLDEIRKINEVALKMLTSYIECYEKWLQFSNDIESFDTEGTMPEEESKELLKLMNEKDKSRSALTSYMDNLAKSK